MCGAPDGDAGDSKMYVVRLCTTRRGAGFLSGFPI